MAENQQSHPSLEELRAAKAALEKKATPPSLDQFRAAKAAQSSKKAPEIPPVEEPTEARPPFSQAPSGTSPAGGALALGPQGPSVSALPSTSEDGTTPSVSPEQKRAVLELGKGPIRLESPEAQAAISPKPKPSPSPVPVITPGTEGFATQAPLFPSQKPDASKQFIPSETTIDAGGLKFTKGETDFAKRQEKLAEQDSANRQTSYYLTEYADLDQPTLDQRKQLLQKSAMAVNSMNREFEGTLQRLQQQEQELLQRKTMLKGMAGQDQPIFDSQGNLMDVISYQQAAQQYDADAQAFLREQKTIGIQQDLIMDLARKGEMDRNAIIRREHDIKAGIGNRPAGLAYNILSSTGGIISGTMELAEKITPNLQDAIVRLAMERIGIMPKREGEYENYDWKQYLKDVENAPVALTGIGQFVTPEYIQKKSEESLFDAGLFAIADMAPAVAASIVGGAPAMAGAFFASSYRDMGNEMQGEYWDQVPEAEKETIRIGTALVSAGLSTMGLQALAGRVPIVNDIFFRVAKKMLPNMTSGQVRRLIAAETKSYVANLASKGAQGFILEAPEEGIDYLSEEAVKNFYENYKRSEFGENADKLFNNAETFEELGNGLFKSMGVGGMAGSIMAGSLAAASSINARQNLTDKEFNIFKAIIEDGSLQRDFESQVAADLALGKIDKAQYDKLIDNIQTAKSIVDQIPDGLTIDATRKAFDLLEEKASLKKKDPALVGDRIKEIDNRLAELSKMKQEAPAPAPEAKVAEAAAPATPTKLELEAQKAEIEDRRAEELERVNIAVAEASETGTSPELDGRAINPEQEINSINAKYDAEVAALTQPKPTADAVQERTTAEVGAQPVGPKGAGQEGRGGVGPSVQGPEAPQAGGPQGQITPPTAEQINDDVRNGRIARFTYGSVDEVPDVLKNRITRVGETEKDGKVKREVEVSMSQSEADYLLQKAAPTAEGPVRPEAPETKTAARNAVSILASSPDVFTASDELSKKGLVMSFGGKSFFNIGGGRDAMVLNINGVPVPVYRSSQGTDSKEKGKWYPFFAMTSEWLAKAMSDNYKDGYGNKAIKDVLDALNSNPAFSYDKPLAANSIDEADLASLIFGEDQNIRDFAKSQNSGGIFDVRNYMLGAMLLDRWNNELGGISLVGATKRVQATIDALKAKNPSRADEIDETWADVLEEFRRLEQKGQEGGWTVDSFASAISQGQKLDSPEAQQFYDNNRNQIEQRLKTIAESEKKAEGPVRPEAPPAPKAETMKLMDDIASLEQKMEQTSNKGVKTRYQNQINKLAPKIGEVMAKFDSTVADLEKSGKLTRRCP